ncbi:MAG TPA: hypothetical protein VHE55_16045 [Fimbriimonadaceae bacterium]|nr:hypothetical protein [Fimbriimonadaceae bacterium]
MTSASLVCGTIATFLTGGAAVAGTNHQGFLEGWRLATSIGAVLSLISALSSGFYKQWQIASRESEAQSWAAKLESLSIQLEYGSVTPNKVVEEYQRCIRETPWLDAALANDRENRVEGTIDAPAEGDRVGVDIACSGTARGLAKRTHLWLAVEFNDIIWPKEKELLPKSGRWSYIIRDIGVGDFKIVLIAANARAHAEIQDWLDISNERNEWPGLKRPAGSVRLTQVSVSRKGEPAVTTEPASVI